MTVIPAQPPGVFTTHPDETLRDRWERSRRFLLYAFVLIPAVGVVSAVVTTIGRGLEAGSAGVPLILLVACLSALLSALVAAGGVVLLRATFSPAGRSILLHPKWWVWAAPVVLLVQGAVMNRVAAAVGSGARGSWASVQFLLPLALLACAGYYGWRAAQELTEPLDPALGDTGIAVDILRESGPNVVMALEVTRLTVTADRIVLEHKRGRAAFGTVAEVGFDRIRRVRTGWAPPGAGGDVWTALPAGSADRLPPGTPAVLLRTHDQDIFLAVGDTALVAELIHRRALRYAALRDRR